MFHFQFHCRKYWIAECCLNRVLCEYKVSFRKKLFFRIYLLESTTFAVIPLEMDASQLWLIAKASITTIKERTDFSGTLRLSTRRIQLVQWNSAVRHRFQATSSQSKWLSYLKFRTLIWRSSTSRRLRMIPMCPSPWKRCFIPKNMKLPRSNRLSNINWNLY